MLNVLIQDCLNRFSNLVYHHVLIDTCALHAPTRLLSRPSTLAPIPAFCNSATKRSPACRQYGDNIETANTTDILLCRVHMEFLIIENTTTPATGCVCSSLPPWHYFFPSKLYRVALFKTYNIVHGTQSGLTSLYHGGTDIQPTVASALSKAAHPFNSLSRSPTAALGSEARARRICCRSCQYKRERESERERNRQTQS